MTPTRRPEPPPFLAPAPDPGRPNRGARLARIGAALGTPLMPWQRLAANVGTEQLADGRPAYPLVVVSVPRQAGKSALGRAVCVDGMTARPDARVWSTAQTRNAARDRWVDGAQALRRSPVFGAHVDLRRANGSEAAALPNGSTWRPFAPLPDALHGETTTRVLVDEAWAFDLVRGTELLQAIIPTGATVPAFQLWIVSAAGTPESEFLADLIASGAATNAAGSGLAVITWQADTSPDAPDLVEAVLAAHPALGHTVTRESIEAAAAGLSPAEFLRAYGNAWVARGANLFDPSRVDAVTVEAGGRPAAWSRIALAADVAPDRGSGALVASWMTDPEDTAPHVAVVAAGPGTSWMVAACAAAGRRYGVPITLDPIGPTAGLADDLRRAGVAVSTLTTRDVTTAAADLLDAVTSGTVRLVDDPGLGAALAVASKRPVGRDAWAFDRRTSAGDIAPLVAAAHALYSVRRPAPLPYLA